MKKSLFFVAPAIAILLLSAPATAKAQVAFGGTFHGPHGSFSIGVGAPFVPAVGAYVPAPFVGRVYLRPDYGYGFVYDSRWIPCRRYGSRWIIAGDPIVYGTPIVHSYGYRYVRPYRYYGRPFARHDFDHRHSRHSSHGHRW